MVEVSTKNRWILNHKAEQFQLEKILVNNTYKEIDPDCNYFSLKARFKTWKDLCQANVIHSLFLRCADFYPPDTVLKLMSSTCELCGWAYPMFFALYTFFFRNQPKVFFKKKIQHGKDQTPIWVKMGQKPSLREKFAETLLRLLITFD